MVSASSPLLRGISSDDVTAIAEGRITDPFAVFGPRHRGRAGLLVAFDPHAVSMEAITPSGPVPLAPQGHGVFAGDLGRRRKYRLAASDGTRRWEYDDAYRFGPVLGDLDLHLIAEGTHRRLWQALGAHSMNHEETPGVHVAVWAPNARRVSVVGGFNGWDGRRHPMRRRGAGVWEIFLPGLQPGEAYKYEIAPPEGAPFLKADPLARLTELPPATASRIPDPGHRPWGDDAWMQTRAARNNRDAPISIYEVHLGSWRHRDGRALTYREAAVELVDYVHDMGFTHLELMPIAEYPFGGSWGYQPTGMYAPTSRYGSPDDFRALVEAAHAKGLGVLMDWVPAHFPNDAHGVAHFDGTALYEHADPREGFHPDWNTHIYNLGRNEVRNFLTANALYWLEDFHLDGLRVDAVASMLYRDYSRGPGAWIPNKDGGRENYESIAFLREMNTLAYGEAPPGLMTVAEESTAWPGVTQPAHLGGLGFGFKWNMGWMNDTLRFVEHDPIHRRHHHDLMTFGLVYGFSENYVLPISHDEVVHGKGSMLEKMPGDPAAKLANLRAYYGFMWGHPGKKLLFMGCEFGQGHEWNHDQALDWGVLGIEGHAGLQRLVRDLNTLYRAEPALHARDADPGGFTWIDREARAESLFSWLRLGHDGQPPVAIIANFTPVERRWRLGLPRPGRWREALNTDAGLYDGGNRGNLGAVLADGPATAGQPHSAEITLPPLSTLFLIPEES
ncbi:1,4-alpha-glucan branching protein GlgB [Pararhodobacter aggregans]|uniref:1,4-alpha-glucan branching enzyme GlgB n=1 Tax=Pararhodobacter aggregans TaxID=404875 RepID=A0A2T7UUR2_9RHOB|nr:1,4-alpha-glucan branching protein GlgB [Pararhodobacter aggregans]PTX04136.1 1,4-alpha-glucan branching enzyme [Pararhodobacter aggregans]PVE48404.1 1,4-alpha-glucan branching enzyme [Pararhodobacter aggregans]